MSIRPHRCGVHAIPRQPTPETASRSAPAVWPARRFQPPYDLRIFQRAEVHTAAFVAGQRRAAHRRTRRDARGIATEGGDERAGVRSALLVRAPASRTASNGGSLSHWRLRDRRRAQCRQSRTSRGDGMSVFASALARLRRATRRAAHPRTRRNALAHRDGHDEHSGLKSAVSVRAPGSRTGSNTASLTRWRLLDRGLPLAQD